MSPAASVKKMERIMRRVLIFLALASAGLAQTSGDDLPQAQIDEIIQKFAAKEAEFARARENYTYRQTVAIQELDEGGNRARQVGDGLRHHLFAGRQAHRDGWCGRRCPRCGTFC